MPNILKGLVVASGPEIQQALENNMLNKLESNELRLVTCAPGETSAVDWKPDLVVAEGKDASGEDIGALFRAFPGKALIVLERDPKARRDELLRAGADEVLSLEELGSFAGRRLLERLLAFKAFADAESRAEQGEERFRDIIERSHDMITLFDGEATVLYVSPAFCRQMGFEPWEVLGQTLFDFVHDDDRISVEDGYRRLLRAPPAEGMSFEFRHRRKDGAWRNIEATASNLLGSATVQAVVFNSRDATVQKQTEVELEKHRLHLEQLVELRTREAEEANRRADAVLAASPDTLIAIDGQGRISFASQHYRTRYPRDAVAFAPGAHILDAFDVIARNILLPADDPRYAEMREWWKKPEGTREFRLAGGMWARLQARPVPGSDEIVISTTDITDYKRQQARLAAQSEALAAALEVEKGVVEQQKTFVSMVSHEFRTPLTIIDGNAQIIERRGETLDKETLTRRAVTIRTAVDRLVRLIETILSAHMIDRGKMTVNPVPCDLGMLIQEAVADQQDISPGHSIRTEIKGLPDKMRLDEKVMRHMLSNLLSNAVKYSPGKPQIDVAAFPQDGQAVLEVRDHGVGIPETELPRIFGKYFRASTSGGIPGSGLGLNLVKQFVELHRGTIDLKSRVGEGTVVTIRLPIIL